MHQYANSWHFYLMSQQEVEGPRWERRRASWKERKEGNEERNVRAWKWEVGGLKDEPSEEQCGNGEKNL